MQTSDSPPASKMPLSKALTLLKEAHRSQQLVLFRPSRARYPKPERNDEPCSSEIWFHFITGPLR